MKTLIFAETNHNGTPPDQWTRKQKRAYKMQQAATKNGTTKAGLDGSYKLKLLYDAMTGSKCRTTMYRD